jgi:hypothetical protein
LRSARITAPPFDWLPRADVLPSMAVIPPGAADSTIPTWSASASWSNW